MFFKSKGLYSFEGRMVRSEEILWSVAVLDLGSLQMNLGLNPNWYFITIVYTFPFLLLSFFIY